jgi:hypothetical protein
MAWTDPAGHVWTTGEAVTAANMNTFIRLNLEETCPDTATTAGDIIFADAANSMGSRVGIGAANTHLVSDGSSPVWRAIQTDVDTASKTNDSGANGTGYFKLASLSAWIFASEIEATVTTGTEALVLWKANIFNDTAGGRVFLSYSVSGATTVAASDTRAIQFESTAAGDLAEFGGFDLVIGLTAGSNVFTLEGRVTAGVGTLQRPEIAVIGF